jgi:hypothetical protein
VSELSAKQKIFIEAVNMEIAKLKSVLTSYGIKRTDEWDDGVKETMRWVEFYIRWYELPEFEVIIESLKTRMGEPG